MDWDFALRARQRVGGAITRRGVGGGNRMGDVRMAYRGEDLDLRTPQTWAAAPVEPAGSGDLSLGPNGKRAALWSGPILVDDTLLACCNNAFDIAVAHRAAEVRIEHLLNAMTRIDAAAAALEARGVRVAALRRETATIVASEIPAVGNGPASPRRSDELADALRLAAGLASRRNGTAGVDDLIQVLLDQRSEFAASELLFRFAARVASRDISEPLPPLTRPAADLRYGATSGLRYGADYQRPYRGELSGTPTDAIQNSRIEALEQMVRALSQDFSNERHIVAGLVRDLSRDTQAHQDDQGRRQTVLLDRIGTLEDAMLETRGGAPNEGLVTKLESIETALEQRLQEMSQSWSVLSTRLQDLEVSVRERPASGGGGVSLDDIREAIDLRPISNRLDIIEEAVLGADHHGTRELGDRFARLEAEIRQALATTTDGGRVDTLLTGFDRIDGLSDKLDTQHGTVTQAQSDLAERLAAVERAVTAEIETAAAKHQAYAHDLNEVHDALLKLNQNQHTLAGSMDQWRTDSASDVANILSRLANLDRETALPAETLNALNTHMDSMNRFIIERYHRRHRFWYWLFGTDDWIAASWASQRAAIEADSQRLKDGEATSA